MPDDLYRDLDHGGDRRSRLDLAHELAISRPREMPRTSGERAAVSIGRALAAALAVVGVALTWADHLHQAELTARARVDLQAHLANLLAHETHEAQERFICALRRAQLFDADCEGLGQ